MKIKFLIIFVFLFLTYITTISAEEYCIFNKSIYLNGSAICETNCEVPLVKIRELSDLCIIPKPHVKVNFEYTKDSTWEPPLTVPRKNLSQPLCIRPPQIGIGYYYRVAGKDVDKWIKIEVIDNKQFQEECVKKPSSQNQPQPTTSTINIENSSQVQISIGGQNTQIIQNPPQYRSIIDYIKDYIVQTLSGITAFIIIKKFIDKYLGKKKKVRKTKSKK